MKVAKTISHPARQLVYDNSNNLYTVAADDLMSAAFGAPFAMMQRPLGNTAAFSIDSLIGSSQQSSPGHFVYTGYPMFMPYRSVVLPPPPPPPPPPGLTQTPHHHQLAALPTAVPGAFCSSLAQGMALTSTLMTSLPQHSEAARKFGSHALHAAFEKSHDIRLDTEDGKSFLGKEAGALLHFHDEPAQSATGESSHVTV